MNEFIRQAQIELECGRLAEAKELLRQYDFSLGYKSDGERNPLEAYALTRALYPSKTCYPHYSSACPRCGHETTLHEWNHYTPCACQFSNFSANASIPDRERKAAWKPYLKPGACFRSTVSETSEGFTLTTSVWQGPPAPAKQQPKRKPVLANAATHKLNRYPLR